MTYRGELLVNFVEEEPRRFAQMRLLNRRHKCLPLSRSHHLHDQESRYTARFLGPLQPGTDLQVIKALLQRDGNKDDDRHHDANLQYGYIQEARRYDHTPFGCFTAFCSRLTTGPTKLT